MQFDRTQIVIRRRQPWEAADLGIALVHRLRRPVVIVWLATALPLWLLLTLATARTPLLLWIVLFWCKPLFDLPLVHLLGRGVFGNASAGAVLRELPANLRRSALPALLLERLDLGRSTNAPVRQLEGLRGRELRRRFRVLGNQGRGIAVAFTMACWLLEISLFVAALTLVSQIVPPPLASWLGEEVTYYFDALPGSGSAVVHWGLSGLWFLAISIVEPLYVAGGLCLYLNRRTELEGWDIEMAFRALAHRHAGASGRRPAAGGRPVAALLIAFTLGTFLTLPSSRLFASAAAPSNPTSVSEAQAAIEEVLAEQAFATESTGWRLRPRFELDADAAAGSSTPTTISIPGLGLVLEVALWILLAGVLTSLVALLARSRGGTSPAAASSTPETESTLEFGGLDLRRESLPSDVAESAREAIRRGELVPALSLLFRGTLSCLVEGGLEVEPSWTELDCDRRCREVLEPEQHAHVRSVLSTWSRAAYMGLEPTPEEIVEIEEICSRYDDFARTVRRDQPFVRAKLDASEQPGAPRHSPPAVPA